MTKFHRNFTDFQGGLIGFAHETSGRQTKGREEEKLSSSPNA